MGEQECGLDGAYVDDISVYSRAFIYEKKTLRTKPHRAGQHKKKAKKKREERNEKKEANGDLSKQSIGCPTFVHLERCQK